MKRMRTEAEDSTTDHIVTRQPVKQAKVEQARALRRRMTEEEKILWSHLRGNRLRGFHFRRQQIIDGFIVDFYCHEAGLVVEVDGDIHHQQAAYDAERDRALVARGLQVVRFKNEEVRKDVGGVLEKVARELPNPPAPFPEGKGEKTADRETGFPLSAPERGRGLCCWRWGCALRGMPGGRIYRSGSGLLGGRDRGVEDKE